MGNITSNALSALATPTVEVWSVRILGSRRVITAMPGAIGNAIYDATGARLREVPFTPARVKAALAAV